jgi:DNA-binding transcriptional regulator YiaG
MKRLEPNEVKAAREALGMTQQQLADALLLESKYSRDTVRTWESGRRLCPGPESIALQLMVADHKRKAAKRAKLAGE